VTLLLKKSLDALMVRRAKLAERRARLADIVAKLDEEIATIDAELSAFSAALPLAPKDGEDTPPSTVPV
jgi:hypothetical protein